MMKLKVDWNDPVFHDAPDPYKGVLGLIRRKTGWVAKQDDETRRRFCSHGNCVGIPRAQSADCGCAEGQWLAAVAAGQ